MAGVVAAAIAVEQVVATGIEAAAAVAIAAPTQPLKVSLSQLVLQPEGTPAADLARSNHTLTIIGDKAYIFGGEDADGKLCNSNLQALALPPAKTHTDPGTSNQALHETFPPFPTQDATTGETLVPAPRKDHAAASRKDTLLIHGGRDASGQPIDEGNCIWACDINALRWSKLPGSTQLFTTMSPRFGHSIFVDEKQDFLVLIGGKGPGCLDTETEVWFYDFNAQAWTTLPKAPHAPIMAAAYRNETLYIITPDGDNPTNLSGAVHYLYLHTSPVEREKPNAMKWETVTFPTSPIAPGPKPREGAALVPITSGYGREYLVYMFGCSPSSDDKEKEFFSDIWTLQLPSARNTGAKAKDKIREKLPGMESGEFSWSEAELIATEQLAVTEGKVHPGPRGLFGADSDGQGKTAVFWGGVNPKGEKEGDGWVLRLAAGYADYDRKE
ncbi:hypothetical protein QBC35DRAFT_443201 [Podospora australis]|uniref:Uncharacterized protein n=1 Tax=Podospora australis TaxID=1536484 RepID=A0AAN6WKL1_9PEZI|nr:hypothetical protein QBC35DRAFT_443201 [Podospora australis]